MQNENESMRAVGYARVSSKDQEDTGYSLPAQEKLLRDFADRNGGDLPPYIPLPQYAVTFVLGGEGWGRDGQQRAR